MKDEEIIELFWQRSEIAIKETMSRYNNYLLNFPTLLKGWNA